MNLINPIITWECKTLNVQVERIGLIVSCKVTAISQERNMGWREPMCMQTRARYFQTVLFFVKVPLLKHTYFFCVSTHSSYTCASLLTHLLKILSWYSKAKTWEWVLGERGSHKKVIWHLQGVNNSTSSVFINIILTFSIDLIV